MKESRKSTPSGPQVTLLTQYEAAPSWMSSAANQTTGDSAY